MRNPRPKAALLRRVRAHKSKKADRYWCAPSIAKTPVISIAEIGYVRRSELRLRLMNMYSALMLQFVAKAHSTPPPMVHVVTTLLSEVVETNQLPQPPAVVRHASTTEPPRA